MGIINRLNENKLDLVEQLNETLNRLEGSSVKTTCWGSRVIEINAFGDYPPECVYVDDLARQLLKKAMSPIAIDKLAGAGRHWGLEIVEKLKEFYTETDKQIQGSNFFTRFFTWIREFSFTSYTPRFNIENEAEKWLRSYTTTRLAIAGLNPTVVRSPDEKIKGYPERIVVKKENIPQAPICSKQWSS